MAVEQEESHYTSPGGKEDEPEQTCPFLPLRLSTPFFFFFPSQAFLSLYANLFPSGAVKNHFVYFTIIQGQRGIPSNTEGNLSIERASSWP